MNQEFVLEGLFQHLVREGFQLSIRDYQDALKALRAGYGTGSRENLLWLCQTLWAQTNEEIRLLNLIFQRFPFPSPEEVQNVTGEENSPQPDEPPREHKGTGAQPFPRPEHRQQADSGPVPEIRFAPPAQSQGIGLSRAQVALRHDEIFILTPKPIVSLRALIIIWRRFRAAKREGPKVELDLNETIREQCRTGLLTEPVLIPARRNQARLIVLMDVSNSMIPWRGFQGMILDSLRKGHLGQVAVYYFHNVPTEVLYERETLTKPVAIEKALLEHQRSTLMIFSDAGAGRGFNRPQRVQETAEFLSKVWSQWQPIVWMNPMPPQRWRNSSAEKISRLAKSIMLQLNEDGLIRAVDVLRGKPLN